MALRARPAALLMALSLLCALIGAPDPRSASAVCPSAGNPPQGPPPFMREPFDPPSPPEEPADDEGPPPPEEPADSEEPPAEPPAEPRDPPPDGRAKPAPPTTPPTTPLPRSSPPPEAPPATTPRGRVAPWRPDVLDTNAWQFWWGLNRPDVLPGVRRQTAEPDGAYAADLPADLHAAADALIDALSDREDEIRYAAAGAWAGFRTTYRALDTLAALRRAAASPDAWLRDLAHLGLGLRRDGESLAGMRRVLRSTHERTVSRAFAALALIQVGTPEAVADLAAVAGDLGEPELAGCVLIGLGQTRDPANLPVLLESARRRTGAALRLRRVRADAITALGKLGHVSTVPYLAGLLGDRENAIARSAAIALGGFRGSEEAASALRGTGLGSQDPWVRALAAVSLGRVGHPSALPDLVRRWREEDEIVRPFVMLGLAQLGDKGCARLLGEPLAEDPRGGAYATAALAAGLLGADEARPALARGLDDTRSGAPPACSALALGLLHAGEARPALLKRFWLDSVRARPGFPEGLAQLDAAAQATTLLGELARARRSGSAQVIVEALAACAGPSDAPELTRRFRAAPKGDSRLRARYVATLAAVLGDRRVTPARGLLLHTYYLQPNLVLGHLALLP